MGFERTILLICLHFQSYIARRSTSVLPLLFRNFLPTFVSMESPAIPVPLDPREQPILERLLRTRDALLLIKQDKSSYIKSRDVLPLYEEVTAEVEKLNAARKEPERRLVHNRRESWYTRTRFGRYLTCGDSGLCLG